MKFIYEDDDTLDLRGRLYTLEQINTVIHFSTHRRVILGVNSVDTERNDWDTLDQESYIYIVPHSTKCTKIAVLNLPERIKDLQLYDVVVHPDARLNLNMYSIQLCMGVKVHFDILGVFPRMIGSNVTHITMGSITGQGAIRISQFSNLEYLQCNGMTGGYIDDYPINLKSIIIDCVPYELRDYEGHDLPRLEKFVALHATYSNFELFAQLFPSVEQVTHLGINDYIFAFGSPDLTQKQKDDFNERFCNLKALTIRLFKFTNITSLDFSWLKIDTLHVKCCGIHVNTITFPPGIAHIRITGLNAYHITIPETVKAFSIDNSVICNFNFKSHSLDYLHVYDDDFHDLVSSNWNANEQHFNNIKQCHLLSCPLPVAKTIVSHVEEYYEQPSITLEHAKELIKTRVPKRMEFDGSDHTSCVDCFTTGFALVRESLSRNYPEGFQVTVPYKAVFLGDCMFRNDMNVCCRPFDVHNETLCSRFRHLRHTVCLMYLVWRRGAHKSWKRRVRGKNGTFPYALLKKLTVMMAMPIARWYKKKVKVTFLFLRGRCHFKKKQPQRKNGNRDRENRRR